MGKKVYELSKLKEINAACKQASIELERVGKATDSISAISDLAVPTLKHLISSAPSYFKLDADKLREVIDSRETTIYSTMCVLTEMDELAMSVESAMASTIAIIDDINSTVNGINDGINSILDDGNSDYSGNNSQGATNHD
ncbi:hypothetical protein EFP02_14130 [Lactiplantibacillus plantarum]|uniref:hypothetical protein n=1 Tax=Lactiplantibacillus plantarum TaxID=1590 RepID=UPI0021A47ABE|nr:hypothetical protein [Lactiplantibacillus plantarum]MCT3248138.1 hypothetical protein [Lactiplantibacillus plantarum]